MSIGFNPVFNNREKTAEPWIRHDFGPGVQLLAVAFWGLCRDLAGFVSVLPSCAAGCNMHSGAEQG